MGKTPAARHRFAGQRTGTAAGPPPGLGRIVAGLVVVAVSMGITDEGTAFESVGAFEAAECGE